jgi:hypothetical protein
MIYQGFEAVAFDITLWSMLVAGVMYLVFGQVTVHRLRKNPATRDCLGISWLSGEDIAHVAFAVSIPRRIHQRAESGCLGFMVAKSEVVLQHTTRLDRILGWLCYWSIMVYLVLLLSSYFILPRR